MATVLRDHFETAEDGDADATAVAAAVAAAAHRPNMITPSNHPSAVMIVMVAAVVVRGGSAISRLVAFQIFVYCVDYLWTTCAIWLSLELLLV